MKTIREVATEVLVEYGLAKDKAAELGARIELNTPSNHATEALETIAKIAHAGLVEVAAEKRKQNSSAKPAARTSKRATKKKATKKKATKKKATKKKAIKKKASAKKKAPAKKRASSKKAAGSSSKFTDEAREKQALARRVWWARKRIKDGKPQPGDKELVKKAEVAEKKAEKQRQGVPSGEQLAKAS